MQDEGLGQGTGAELFATRMYCKLVVGLLSLLSARFVAYKIINARAGLVPLIT
jgi:hypothetical protein